MGQRGPLDLHAKLRRVMEAKGLRGRDVVRQLARRHAATAYDVLGGQTDDPRASTLLDVCRGLGVDPDELLGTARAPLAPELQGLWEEAQALSEDDKRLVGHIIRAVCRVRAESP